MSGASTYNLENSTGNLNGNLFMWLLSGEKVQWNVTVAGVASTADATLNVEEYETP